MLVRGGVQSGSAREGRVVQILSVKNQLWPLQLAEPTLCVGPAGYTKLSTFKAFYRLSLPKNYPSHGCTSTPYGQGWPVPLMAVGLGLQMPAEDSTVEPRL